ncbi:heavy metal-associated domain-containing protein [Neobacillus niacini]
MTCASCAIRIEKGFGNVEGLIQANINLAKDKDEQINNPALTYQLN